MSIAPSGLHPLLASRYSPIEFRPDRAVLDHELELLLEAARWAPSAGNSQPWAFHAARPGEAGHDRLLRYLAPSSARWAPAAGLLVVTLAHQTVGDSDLEYSEFSDYDLGQAVAHLTLQAQALGLSARQFRAFDREALTADLAPAPGWQIRTMIAVGAPANAAGDRPRRSVEDLQTAPWPETTAGALPRVEIAAAAGAPGHGQSTTVPRRR